VRTLGLEVRVAACGNPAEGLAPAKICAHVKIFAACFRAEHVEGFARLGCGGGGSQCLNARELHSGRWSLPSEPCAVQRCRCHASLPPPPASRPEPTTQQSDSSELRCPVGAWHDAPFLGRVPQPEQAPESGRATESRAVSVSSFSLTQVVSLGSLPLESRRV